MPRYSIGVHDLAAKFSKRTKEAARAEKEPSLSAECETEIATRTNGSNLTDIDHIQGFFFGPEIGTPEIGTPEIGTPEIGTPEIGTPEIGTPEIGTPEIGTPEIGTPEIGTPEINIFQKRL